MLAGGSTVNPIIETECELRDLLELASSPAVLNQLSDANKKRLQSFLPPDSTASEGSTLDKLKSDLPHIFTSQSNLEELKKALSSKLSAFFSFSPDASALALNAQRRLQYEKSVRHYHVKLLEKLLTSRRELLRSSATLTDLSPKQPSAHPVAQPLLTKRNLKNDTIFHRASKRSKFTFQDIRDSFGQTELSSDEEDVKCDEAVYKPSDADLWRVQRVADAMNGTLCDDASTLPKHLRDVSLHQSIDVENIDDLIDTYRSLRSSQPDHPSLEFSEISLARVIQRAGMEGYLQKVAPSLVKVLLPTSSAAAARGNSAAGLESCLSVAASSASDAQELLSDKTVSELCVSGEQMEEMAVSVSSA